MINAKQNYQYLLRLYSAVDEYLSNIPAKQENLPEIIVSFCVVTEKFFKIKLHKENPVLVYENIKIKEDDALIAVIKEKELNIETIKIRETISRYKLIFDDEFSDDEMQVLVDVYNARNHFVHGYKSDNEVLSDKENIVKKMGTVWEKISAQAISIFGKDLIKANKPKKKYSEEELEKVLIEEVRKKIENPENDYIFPYANNEILAYSPFTNNEICPRCGSYGFSTDNSINSDTYLSAVSPVSFLSRHGISDLYKCQRCHLELTKKEYEIAKEIKSEFNRKRLINI